ncbi:MAG: hypothetical protein QHG98_03625 [Methanothrix sp.]|jgi:transposase|uniref:hypothetical protein n=1 Tax=Methanothrix sp. TaxID=90426 RepID=UPI00247EFD6D|nr:hypothetical protein [Methanothrix sp.]
MVVKPNERKIRYTVREKIKNRSNKRIAAEMKVSVSTVKRVWRHYLRKREMISIKMFGRPRKEIDPELEDLVLEVHKEQNLGARSLEQIALIHLMTYPKEQGSCYAFVSTNECFQRPHCMLCKLLRT